MEDNKGFRRLIGKSLNREETGKRYVGKICRKKGESESE